MASDSHAEYAKRLLEAVLTGDGDTDPSVREAVKSLSAQIGERFTFQTETIPPELISYIKKFALRNAGYSEDAIFEITLSAALGAGMARLDHGLAALKDANQ